MFRMSVNWTRLFPRGDEKEPNRGEIEFYRKLIDFFLNYCRVLFAEFKGLVRYWLTFNEINILLMGAYGNIMGGGILPPGTDTAAGVVAGPDEAGMMSRGATRPCITS